MLLDVRRNWNNYRNMCAGMLVVHFLFVLILMVLRENVLTTSELES